MNVNVNNGGGGFGSRIAVHTVAPAGGRVGGRVTGTDYLFVEDAVYAQSGYAVRRIVWVCAA